MRQPVCWHAHGRLGEPDKRRLGEDFLPLGLPRGRGWPAATLGSGGCVSWLGPLLWALIS